MSYIPTRNLDKVSDFWFETFKTTERSHFGTALNVSDVIHIEFEEQKYSEGFLRVLHNSFVFRWLVPILKEKKKRWKKTYMFDCPKDYDTGNEDTFYWTHGKNFIKTVKYLEKRVKRG